MSNGTEIENRSQSISSANETSHYVLVAVGTVIGFIGAILRFVGDWAYIDLASDIIFIIGTIICLKAVFGILK